MKYLQLYESNIKVIEILQNSSTNPACCEEGCDKPFLGPNQNFICYNTRPGNC